MNATRVFFLVLCFFIDVQVKATEAHSHSCWGEKIPCAIKAGKIEQLKADGLRLALDAGAVIEQRSSNRIQLVNGLIYVETERPVIFSTAFGEVTCASACRALLERELETYKVQSLGGDWQVTRKGDKQVYQVVAGHQVAIGEVTPEGQASMDFPQGLPWLETMKNWARLFPGKADEFKAAMREFRETWTEAVEAASDMQLKEAGRTIASYEAALAREAARRRAQEREDEGLRRLFREKNYIYP